MWSIFPCAFIVLHFVSTVYLLNLTCWNWALFELLFWWFTPGHFIYSPVGLLTIKSISAPVLCVSINLYHLIALCPLNFLFWYHNFFLSLWGWFSFIKSSFMSIFRFHLKWCPMIPVFPCLTSLSTTISDFFPESGNGISSFFISEY